MKLTFASLCLLALVSLALASTRVRPRDRNTLPYKVVCYWGTWAYYRPGLGQFQPEQINPNLCTHINYGFAKLTGNRIELYDPDLDVGSEDWTSGLPWGRGMIRRLTNLRNSNPNLSTMIAIGGWNEGSDKYSLMASTEAGRQEFIQSVLDFIKEHDFDGLDLDWEYPAMSAVGDADRVPGRDQDKHDFIALIKELHEAFQPYGYLLTAAVSAGAPTIDRAYDVEQVSRFLDFVNLMTYDFHGGWDNVTGHNAPLYPMPGATGIDLQFTTSYAVEYWLQLGVDPKKLVVGIPLYGRTFTLASASQAGLGAPAVGKGGKEGPFTRIEGMLGYNEVCTYLQTGYVSYWNDIQQIPYAVSGTQWVGYDDVRSIGLKLDYVISKGLGGGMIWTIDTDDFTGSCGGGTYPLLKTISSRLNGVSTRDPVIKPQTHPNEIKKGERVKQGQNHRHERNYYNQRLFKTFSKSWKKTTKKAQTKKEQINRRT